MGFGAEGFLGVALLKQHLDVFHVCPALGSGNWYGSATMHSRARRGDRVRAVSDPRFCGCVELANALALGSEPFLDLRKADRILSGRLG